MLKKIYTILAIMATIFLLPTTSTAQVQEGIFLGNWQDDSLPEMFYGRYNETWGIVVNGVEYGVIGSTMGTHFISLEPDNGVLQEVAFVPAAAQGSGIIHRDFHSYGNYLYAVADEGNSTLQIIDFSGLPASVDVVYDSFEFIQRAHNIFIDEDNARLYATNGKVLSLANPAQPTLLDAGFFGGHDVFIRDHILIEHQGNSGMRVIDYTDYNNPNILGTFSNYPNGGYNHSGWMSEDGSHYFLCDETGGSYVKSLDIADYNDIEIVDLFKADNENPDHIAHNAMVRDNLVYVSYYSDGIQVFDATDPSHVVRKYFYDTYPGIDNSGFKGAWGVYSLLPSGRVLVSDMATGFYLMEFPPDQTIFALATELTACTAEDLVFETLIGADFANTGVDLSVAGLPAGATASFSENPATPGSIVAVTISNLTEADNFDLEILAGDGDASSSTSVAIAVLLAPQPIALNLPANGSTTQLLTPTFAWEAADGQEKLIEISSFPNFDEADILSTTVFGSAYTLTFELEQITTYYWRVSSENGCGEVSSDINSFTTLLPISTEEINADLVSINPNPVQDEMIIETGDYFQGTLAVELFDINGRSIRYWNFFNADQQFTLNPPAGLGGLFLLRLSNAENTLTKKILFEE
ncbi:MAG: choice-of-anchor B domain-containing protein [Saprospiraceae bacterium]|jgi:choice-of-anchor B domain-containing protein